MSQTPTPKTDKAAFQGFERLNYVSRVLEMECIDLRNELKNLYEDRRRLLEALRECRRLANSESNKGAQAVILVDDLLAKLGEKI